MATLDVDRLYSDGEVLTESQLDQIRTDLEDFFNTVKITDDNIQNAGLTGSTTLADGSITTSKLQNSSILSAKIVSEAVTAAKIANGVIQPAKVQTNGVTAAKLNTLFLPVEEGSIRLFHTYNSNLEIPRGWMICNGEVVNETNYNALHGSGAYTTDGISSSNLLSKNLPNFSGRIAAGTDDTTQDGSSAITAIGVTGNQIDLSHSHTIESHTHSQSFESAGQNSVGSGSVVKSEGSSTAGSATLSTTLSSTQSIEPLNIEFLYIMRVI